jgi:hypothetical protein
VFLSLVKSELLEITDWTENPEKAEGKVLAEEAWHSLSISLFSICPPPISLGFMRQNIS